MRHKPCSEFTRYVNLGCIVIFLRLDLVQWPVEVTIGLYLRSFGRIIIPIELLVRGSSIEVPCVIEFVTQIGRSSCLLSLIVLPWSTKEIIPAEVTYLIGF